MTNNRGTMLYRSPEQFHGKEVLKKVDVFYLGLVLLVILDFGAKKWNTYPQSGKYN